MSGTHYVNNDFIVDFVVYNNNLYSCKTTHVAEDNNSPEEAVDNWIKVISAPKIGFNNETNELFVSNNDVDSSIYKLKFSKRDDGYLYLEKLDGDSEQLGLVSPIFVGETEPKVNELDKSKVLWFDTSEEALSKPELFIEAYNSIVGSNRSLEELSTILKIVNNIQERFANINVDIEDLTSEYKAADKKSEDRIKKIEDLKIDDTYATKKSVSDLDKAYKAADSKLSGRVKAIEDLKIDDTYAKKEEVKNIKKEILGITDDKTIDEAYDTLVEIAD